MADTLPFEVEEDLFTPSAGASPGLSVASLEAALQSFATLNYDRQGEWKRDRARVDLIAGLQGLSGEQMQVVFEAKIPSTYPSGPESWAGRPSEIPSSPSRLDRIVALLTRQESLELLDQLSRVTEREDAHSRLVRFLLTSNRNLHTFASLVDQDLIGLDAAGLLTLTEVGERTIRQIASDTDSA